MQVKGLREELDQSVRDIDAAIEREQVLQKERESLLCKLHEMERERQLILERERSLRAENAGLLDEIGVRDETVVEMQRKDREKELAHERQVQVERKRLQLVKLEHEQERAKLLAVLSEREVQEQHRRAALDVALRRSATESQQLVECEKDLERARAELRTALDDLAILQKQVAATTEGASAGTSDALSKIRSMCEEMDALRREKKTMQVRAVRLPFDPRALCP